MSAKTQPLRVTFFGDSICVGQGVSLYKGWVTRVARLLDRYGQTRGREILVTNSSVNGRTTRQALEDMPYHIQAQGVDILVVQFGLNDCNYWKSDMGLPRVSLNGFRENICEIVARGIKAGAKVVLLNNNHPTTRSQTRLPHTSITYEQSNIKYCSALKNLQLEISAKYYFQDVYQHFLNATSNSGHKLEEFLLPDGLHLNQRGHDQYYALIKPVILQAIQDLDDL
jgi:acyl-CoA thioesterase-1